MGDEQQVGRYQIIKELGKGAMGVVYLAQDPQIGRKVAVKTIKPKEGARPEEVAEGKARFLREAQAAGKLLHPNIVTIFDVFEDRGTMYIVMEYVEGILLDHFCVKSRLMKLETALSLVCQGLSALDYAHRHGIVHRDIKPGNMMVVNGESLKVMDFGLAKEADAHLTQTGMVIGTPHYMSPEQIQGKLLDGRSDLFSMGVVLYELVTGERPFRGEALSTIIYKILHETPIAPRQLNPDLPEALSRIIQKALSKNPEDRFLTGQAFIEALTHYSEMDLGQSMVGSLYTPTPTQEVLPPPPSGIRRIRRASRRSYRKYLIGASVAALAAAVSVGGWLFFAKSSGRSEPPRPSVPAYQEKMPRPIGVTTQPAGAQLYLDGKAVAAITLMPGDASPHKVEARLGCLYASGEVRNTPSQKDLRLTLEPRPPFAFHVESSPSGASVAVDGRDTGLKTPADIQRNDCSPFTVALSMDGRETFEQKIDPSKDGSLKAEMAAAKPRGTLRLEAASATIKFYLGDRLLGASGQEVQLPEGPQAIRVVDSRVRGERTEKITIEAGRAARLKAEPFDTGRVFLHGKPVDDGKVFVDGAYLGDLPLVGDAPLAVGQHQFRVEDRSGHVVSFGWNVRDGEQTKVVNFETRKVEDI
ncbi:MAG: serine/threonine protein kinase [Acidobacteria bacterium]|jgi:serine/threonine protein kinase|nr:serine/threonine protein kinase [Acidobacteriota bacterium]